MDRLLRWTAVIAATVGAATVAFWLLVHLERPGWPSREYAAIAVWSVPLGFLVLLIARPLRSRLLARPIARTIAGALAALLAAIVWTFLAVVLTGGYALAFDANPLWCWTLASLAGVAIDLTWPAIHVIHGTAAESAI